MEHNYPKNGDRVWDSDQHYLNAIINSVRLEIEDHGTLTVWMDLKFDDGTGQGFGGFALYLPKSYKYHTLESLAGHFIYRVLEIADVTRFDELKGRTIRVERTKDRITAIGHIVNDDWFCPSDDFEEITKANAEADKEELNG